MSKACVTTLVALAVLCGLGASAFAADLAPATKGLQLWVRADDLKAYKDGDRIDVWPDASGAGRHLQTKGDARPSLQADGIAGLPTVVFAGDPRANPKVNQFFDLPLTGEWGGITVFAVGKRLAGPGWFDTRPGGSGCLRTMGWLQLTGTKISLGQGFPALAGKDGPQLAEIVAGITPATGAMTLATYADGQLQGESKDDSPLNGIAFLNAHIGNNNGGEAVFNGELAEVLIYKGALTEKDRLATERYLLVKYGLAAAAPDEKVVDITKKAKTPPPPVKSVPNTNGLQLWVQADALGNLGDGQPVERVPDASGKGHDLTAAGDNRPRFKPDALNGRPALRFEGNTYANPKTVHYLNIPITGEWPEMTLLVAGRNLSRAGVFDSAPGGNQCLRTMGWLQLTGSKLAPGAPFPLLQHDQGAQMMAITIRKTADGGQTLTTYANGHQQTTTSADTLVPVLFRNAHFGTNNTGETAFNGEIAEVLLYDRPLSDVERKQSEKYLAEKYGISLKTAEQIEREQKARSKWTLKYPQLPRTMSWYGNTFSGKTAWLQSGISGITALPDGTVVATSVWDEPHNELGLYKDGRMAGKAVSGGCSTVISDGKYLYVGISGMGQKKAGIKRFTLDRTEAPWPGMPPKEWPMFDTPAIWSEVNGLAIIAGELFVTTMRLDEVRVYDVATGQFKRTFPVPQPQHLAADGDGKLWVGVPEGVAQYAADGTPTGKTIPGVTVGALTLDGNGRLVVADCGERQQVIFYDLTGAQPKEVGTIGEKGGVYAGPRRGATGDTRLWSLNGVGVDAAGNVYTSGGGMLRSYTPDGKLRWHLECTVFCTCSDLDPATDGNDLYSGYLHYTAAPGKPAGKDWVWKGVTQDTRRFPELSRGNGQNVLVRRLGGQLYRFTLGDAVYIHRQEKDSEIFAPCGMYFNHEYKNYPRPQTAPEKGRFFWSDGNGNGRLEANEFTPAPQETRPSEDFYSTFIDDNGGIWEPQDRKGVRYLPLKGISPQGALLYDFAAEVWFPRPAEFIQIFRALYYPATDTMYLSGATWDHSMQGNEHWGNCGHEVIRYDDWSKPTRKLRCRMPFPEGVVNVKAITVAHGANRLFAGEMETSVIFTYDTLTGKLLGIVEPDAELVGGIGWIDIDSGIRAYTRKNGEIILLVEDSWAQKEMIYRLPAAPPK